MASCGVEGFDESWTASAVASCGVESGFEVDDGIAVELPDLVDIEVVVNKRAPCTADSGAKEAKPQAEGRVSFSRDCSHPLGHAPIVPAMV